MSVRKLRCRGECGANPDDRVVDDECAVRGPGGRIAWRGGVKCFVCVGQGNVVGVRTRVIRGSGERVAVVLLLLGRKSSCCVTMMVRVRVHMHACMCACVYVLM